jgi:hypothetical protein
MPDSESRWIEDTKWAIRRSVLYRPLETLRHRLELFKWRAGSTRGPAPHLVKQQVILIYARRHGIRMLVESGTYLGTMVNAMKRRFDRIVSVELDEKLCEAARRRFARSRHISILQGDSAAVLPEILRTVREPCLFWLDGHYSGGITALGSGETPIVEELKAIAEHPIAGHVILIDDARDFTGLRGYPSLEALKQIVRRLRRDWHVEIKDDIVRIHAGSDGG